ncbi:unnamed protein product [Caenorhabditis auriculariae]|uniref:Uncharacterized protein n=1 Tax=Caenorhabditis auriculariae TaxID=2777116 RepID=A0A8S1H1G0_9PELO|nr:unnamed protein product [Caenorhabditis auriculariae]
MSDDWGCNVELFGENPNDSSSQTLTQLVDCLTAKKDAVSKVKSSDNFFPLRLPQENVQVVPCIYKRPSPCAPKILKKKNKNAISKKETSVKRVTFEVEQLLAREACKEDSESAKERLVQSLGGLPLKKPYANYKKHKEEIARKKTDSSQR